MMFQGKTSQTLMGNEFVTSTSTSSTLFKLSWGTATVISVLKQQTFAYVASQYAFDTGFIVIGGHLPQAVGYVPFLHKLQSDFGLEDAGKLFKGLAFDPMFYSVDCLYNDWPNSRIVGMGAPRDINFGVISGKRHIFF